MGKFVMISLLRMEGLIRFPNLLLSLLGGGMLSHDAPLIYFPKSTKSANHCFTSVLVLGFAMLKERLALNHS